MATIILLGGAEEIGANSTYLNLDGNGIIIDAGLHPRIRDHRAFPDVELVSALPTDLLIVTHAHTDHLGGVPFVMRRFPHLQILMTRATRDLSHIMLHNSSRLLRSDVAMHFTAEQLEFYEQDQVELLRQAFEAADYNEPITLRGYDGRSDVKVTLHWAGHLLGSAGVSFEVNDKRILHTGDVQFDDQKVIKGADLPTVHADVVITEATNCATDNENDSTGEAKKLAEFINNITDQGGSVLIPCFALGKTQEMLAHVYSLMRKGSIPTLPIYVGGMGLQVNKVYDHFCYTEPTKIPGFEISDIPFEYIKRNKLLMGDYFNKPSILIVPSGMVNKGTISHTLAKEWMRLKSFGIAFIGYQDPNSAGYALLNSEKNKPFDFGGVSTKRVCSIARLRFSAHASKSGLVGYITTVNPSTVVINHGEPEACDRLALALIERMPGVRIIIPRPGTSYELF